MPQRYPVRPRRQQPSRRSGLYRRPAPVSGQPEHDAGQHAGESGSGPGPRPPGARRPLRHQLADWLDLPKDVMLDLPRISVVGDLQILIQNHRGVKEYTPSKVVVGMDRGAVVISGADLSIGAIHSEEIIITGRLDGIDFRR